MKFSRTCLAVLLLLCSTAAWAQTTSSLTGHVVTEGSALPGVTVTISSPAMQGTRTAYTDVNGNFIFGAVPPGDFTVKFEMESMQPVTRHAVVGLGQTGRADAELKLSAVAEAITVTASAPAVLETQEIQTNVKQELVEDLPVGRTFQAQASIAPNVNTNTPTPGQLVISGAPAHENLYMVNGAVINENLRSQIHNLFIEDAIQEQTVLTGAISAEYGRFTGGVVNAITKSGGNEFSGSIRDSLTNNNWTTKTPDPHQPDPTDHIDSVYEATLGGRIVRDRLWFFGAARSAKIGTDNFLTNSNVKFQAVSKNTRYEGKLTGQITPKHSVVVSYLDIKNPQTGVCLFGCYEFSSIDPSRETPNSFKTAHYSGILTDSVLVEANWSKKFFAFVDGGGPTADFAHGSWGLDLNEGQFFGAPVFCSDCGSEQRNNKTWDLKLSYYLASKSLGTHSVSAGYQDWAEQHISNNYQSGSNFGVYTFGEQTPVSGPNDTFHPVISPNRDIIVWFPIFELTKGSNFVTRSLYVNDKWDLNTHWGFTLGLRYDKNNGKDASGFTRANDSTFEPRLGATYDVLGNGRLRFNASYSKYAAKIAETVGNGATGAGNPAYIFYRYRGPAINAPGCTPGTANCGVDTVTAFQTMYNWFQSQGGVNGVQPFFGVIPGLNTKILGSLKSPDVNEVTLGAGSQIGKGFVRLDLINRNWGNFYANRVDQSTGQVVDQFGNPNDIQQIFTSDQNLERTYRAASIQAAYPFTQHVQFGANYTYAKTRGNVTAETPGVGPVPETIFQYPEYKAFAENNPVGFLPSDETNKVRAWATWAVPTHVGNFVFSALERIDTGTPYSALLQIDPSQYLPESVTSYYAGAPSSVNYYLDGQRGNHRWDTVNALDLSINYKLRVGRAELYLEPELINAFNQAAKIAGSTTVFSAVNDSHLEPFNPFTEKPVLGKNYRFSSTFGQARNASDYALMRTYRVSFGARF
ncbi:MAG TPA: carboxypeptidase regulatory-like domain-containing protein [Thermoanaerobaculia bacterium]|nr:carboxypeptidase regulatory-like domain-containing protein [Thermoanaerobaculia bacterium]